MQQTKTHTFRRSRVLLTLAFAILLCDAALGQYHYIRLDSALLFNTATANTSNSGMQPVEFPEILKGNESQTLDYIERFSERRRDYLIRMYQKGKTLLPKAAGILKKFNLPEELKVLMILESAYNPHAVSRAGAVGYWQFMDAVAKEYGLRYIPREAPSTPKTRGRSGKKKGREQPAPVARARRNKPVDERTHFVKATQAAARYLCDRRRNLDSNWLLVVASYNCGVGNVWEAMEKCGKENPDFWDVKAYLPAETQAYVMNFITLNVIYRNYSSFLQRKLLFSVPEQDTDCHQEAYCAGNMAVCSDAPQP